MPARSSRCPCWRACKEERAGARRTLSAAWAVEASDAAFGVAAVVDGRESQGLKIVFEMVIFLQTSERAMSGNKQRNKPRSHLRRVSRAERGRGLEGGRRRTVGNHTGHLPGQRAEGNVFPLNQGLIIGQRGEVFGNFVVDVDAAAQQDGILLLVRYHGQSAALL